MRVLLAHNSYLQPGGEDVAFEADATLLRDHGHEVRLFRVSNEQAALLSRPALAISDALEQANRHVASGT